MSGPGAPADPNAARYDRQLRLWGANGQRALMEARVLVLGASATAAETLKNLVLPGIGHFTIVDGATVTRRDLGNNFFLIEEHVGQPRAAAMTQMLLEMNDDVRGEAKVVDPAQLLAAEPDFLSRGWDLVVATQMDGTTLASVAAKAWDAEVPLMILRSIGLLGYLRLQLRRHEVVEAKPDAKHWDLRLADKWPELDEFCRSFDMGGLDDRAHRHVPFVVILSQRMEAWRAAHGGRAPKSMAEKNDFKVGQKPNTCKPKAWELRGSQLDSHTHTHTHTLGIRKGGEQILRRRAQLPGGGEQLLHGLRRQRRGLRGGRDGGGSPQEPADECRRVEL
mmetsp:Transcript_26450/g.82520  ORF Transcript_26450/g.82520 Transcript_26450/m.82520 type:complete len:335 (-) Transcript_26450:1421-2425(-)